MFLQILLTAARILFWWIAAGILLVTPWLFGGMSPLGTNWVVWSGWLCLPCLAIWLFTSKKLHPGPGKGFWIALVCWSLLAGQIWLSLGNRSHTMLAPWTTSYLVFNPVEHSYALPSTAFLGATQRTAIIYLSLGLIALTGYCLGMARPAFRRLMALFVFNTAVLAAIGIPFKYSGEKLMLGKWEFQEWYFYSTFYYHNHWAAFVLLGLGAAMSLFAVSRAMTTRLVLVLGMAVMLVSLVVAKTRLGCLTGILLVVVFLIHLQRGKALVGSVFRWVMAGVLSVSLAAGGVFWWQSRNGGDSGGREWESLIQSNPIGVRGTLFADTLTMIGRKPLFGWGLGAYGAAFQHFQRPESISVHNGTPTRYEHPHDDWLERVAELGLIGSMLLWLPGLVWFLDARKQNRLTPGKTPLFLASGILLLFAFGDMAFANYAVCAGFALVWGLITNPAGSPKENPMGNAPEHRSKQKSGLKPERPKSKHMSRS